MPAILPSDLPIVLLGACVLGAGVLLFEVWRVRAQVAQGRWRSVDGRVRGWCARHRTRKGEILAAAVAVVGKPRTVLLTGAALAYWLWHARESLYGLVPLVAAIIAGVGQTVLKRHFQRTRPPRAATEGTTEPSFPSGHAAGTLAVYGTAPYLLERLALAAWWTTAPLALVVCLAVGLAQLYRERHWLSDLVGGYLLGGAICLLSIGAIAVLADAVAGTRG